MFDTVDPRPPTDRVDPPPAGDGPAAGVGAGRPKTDSTGSGGDGARGAPVDAGALGDALAALRRRGPLVQCLTNVVVSNWTANVLLAVGAAPAMVDNAQEAAGFAGIADGVLVNLGTPQDDTVAGMTAAVTGCRDGGTPWVLDPIGAGGLPWRTDRARELAALSPPRLIRGNASEIIGLAGGAGGRGADTTDAPEAALDSARILAEQHRCVVAVSGPVDHLTDGHRVARLGNGHEWLTRVTGVGCSLGALMAAFAGVVDDALVAACAATATLTIAAEQAVHAGAPGPGSFAVALLDRLYALAPHEVTQAVRLS